MDAKKITSRLIKTELIDWRTLQFIQAGNFKEFDPTAKQKLRTSLLDNQFCQPFYVWEERDSGVVYCLDGKHRVELLDEMIAEGHEVPEMLPANFIDCQNKREAAKLVVIYSAIYAKVTPDGLFEFMSQYQFELPELAGQVDLPDFDMLSMFERLKVADKENEQLSLARQSLSEKFIISPFSIFDTRKGTWQDRKRKWITLGIESDEGRDEELFMSKSGQSSSIYELRNRMRAATGIDPVWEEILTEARRRGLHIYSGTSVFDPVLCEILYSWFNIPGGRVLDPFAGGSVRGIVASELGQPYVGIDIRPEQVAANFKQKEKIGATSVEWVTGDSRNIGTLLKNQPLFDFLFSCPPYADLEVYSDIDGDISNMEYSQFIEAYREIIKQSCAQIQNNRFACFVVGDIRDEKGFYRNFTGATIEAFEMAGFTLYNEIILINVAGSLPIRVGKQMTNSRKVGKLHQNVLVFYKGDPAQIKNNYQAVEVKEFIEND